MREGAAIRVSHVSKTFIINHQGVGSLKTAFMSRYRIGEIEKREVLKDISFEVKWGECFALLGNNGAGKSTLLSLIARVYRPTEGTIEVNGRVAPLLELGAGFHPDLTGLENIVINGVILGMKRKEVIEKIPSIIEFAELEASIDAPLRTYSSGMMARLGFATAIHTNPDVLIVDEALSVGDYAFTQKCFRYIQSFRANGGTILFVSHDATTIRQVANHVIWLKDGRIEAEGDPNEITDRYLAYMTAKSEQQRLAEQG
ncbi:MAG: ABC transporter ATP-binding protein [Armatimonadetes bacterium]|nr:ABC transporter ATP-binding protein [Armatimonadota bacterium]